MFAYSSVPDTKIRMIRILVDGEPVMIRLEREYTTTGSVQVIGIGQWRGVNVFCKITEKTLLLLEFRLRYDQAKTSLPFSSGHPKRNLGQCLSPNSALEFELSSFSNPFRIKLWLELEGQ